jgi:probable phosphoglycerate mutase
VSVSALERPPERRIVLWRHGRTAWNLQGRFQGHSDIPLDELGLDQAERAARMLAALHPHRIVASDLSRAHTTAQALSRHTGLPVETDPRLRETHGGVFEGLVHAEIVAQHGEAWRAWQAGDPDVPVGGGESRREVAARMLAAVTEIRDALAPGELAVVATHGGAARLVIAATLGVPLEQVQRLGVMSNCAWSVLGEAPWSPWVLVEYNAGTLPEPVTVEEG